MTDFDTKARRGLFLLSLGFLLLIGILLMNYFLTQ